MALPEKLKERLYVWFTYNVVFALTPFILSVFFHGLAHSLSRDEIAKSPEILFFAVMVSATSFGDMIEKSELLGRLRFRRLFRSSLLIGAVMSAALYGALLLDTIILETMIPGPKPVDIRGGLLMPSIYIAVALFIISTVVEVNIGRAEGC